MQIDKNLSNPCIIVTLPLTHAAAFAQQKGTFTDSRDGKKYKTVKIGKQIWMAENLNYNASGSVCYKNDSSNCQKYGRLYDWNTAKDACPSGWHLPSHEEWVELTDYVGGEEIAGKKLKSSSGWNESGNGTDTYGFSALPGGYGISDGYFYRADNYGYWWSASESSGNAYSCYMHYSYEGTYWYNSDKGYLFSVRCVQD